MTPELQREADHSAAEKARGLVRRRLSFAWLLGALVLLLLATPLLQDLQHGKPIEAILLTMVLVFAVLAVGARRRTLALAIILVVPAIATRWAEQYQAALIPPGLSAILGALFIAFVVAHIVGFILRAPRVNAEVLCAAIAAYLLLALVWALAYMLVARLVPDAFAFPVVAPSDHTLTPFDALYFSFVTLSTVGYGDIVPIARVARMLAILEATTGLFYVTILIARLVALYSSPRNEASGAPPQG